MKKKIAIIAFLILILGGSFALIKLKNNLQTSNGLEVVGKVPSFSFTNHNGEPITEKNFSGKVWVVDFFFTSCPTICPIMTHNMLRVASNFPDNSLSIASFTIDPETDTQEVLKEYSQIHALSNPNWHFLRGTEEAVMKLSNEGFNIYAGKGSFEEGGFEHSGLFALIDQNGNIVSRKGANNQPIIYYRGTLQEEIDWLVEDIKKLQQKN